MNEDLNSSLAKLSNSISLILWPIFNDLINLLKNQLNCEENLPAYDIIKNIREVLSRLKNCFENKTGIIDKELEKLQDNYFQKGQDYENNSKKRKSIFGLW